MWPAVRFIEKVGRPFFCPGQIYYEIHVSIVDLVSSFTVRGYGFAYVSQQKWDCPNTCLNFRRSPTAKKWDKTALLVQLSQTAFSQVDAAYTCFFSLFTSFVPQSHFLENEPSCGIFETVKLVML